jgi:2-methylaconitate cis-trans-isomerase PrpF
MHPEMEMIRCTIMRGGTSKGIYIHKNELPSDPLLRNKVIQAIFGSPDARQIDGLGGADPLTSKLAIVAPSDRPDADVEYTFAQVGIEQNIVDYGGNCGNISSGVGPFAIDEGMVEAISPVTRVRIWQTNTKKLLVAEVPVSKGKSCVEGDCRIDGVPGSGAKISMDFSDTVGSTTGKLLPTGNVVDVLTTKDGSYSVSIVDAAIPVVFISAESLSLQGTESAKEIDAQPKLLERIESIRSEAAVKIGMAESPEGATAKSPYSPFIAIVSPPADYKAAGGEDVGKDDVDVVSRLLFMQKMHKTYPGTGSIATGAAARIKGSVVNCMLNRNMDPNNNVIRIGHPAGVMSVESEVQNETPVVTFKKLAFYRTARKIMDGVVYVRKTLFSQHNLGRRMRKIRYLLRKQ